MRMSRLFTKTQKNVPADETSKNAQLLIKAGFIHKTMAGAYSYLPLGKRVLDKIENIVRKYLNKIGAQEVSVSVLSPQEVWEKTNRWDTIPEYFQINSQTGNKYRPAPTAEEGITPIVAGYISSYKDVPEFDPEKGIFPLAVYQINTKFRDELRSKAGIMRGREFRMKDMYDFHPTKDSQQKYYEVITATYLEIFEHIGIKAYPVQASGGVFTKKLAREFQTECSAGEDISLLVEDTNILYNQEVAPSRIPIPNIFEESKGREDVEAHGIIGVEELCKHLKIKPTQTTKTIFYHIGNDTIIAAVVRGDYDINEEKLAKVAQSDILEKASTELILSQTGAEIGYAGLINLPTHIPLYCDDSLEGLCNFETGTNKTGFHSINCNFSRDIPLPKLFYDIKMSKGGDIHPETGKPYKEIVTAEVGHIFDLGTRFTEAFGVKFTDEQNIQHVPFMGCHGLGTSRCMGVIAENYSDDNGLIWPESIAPFTYHLVTHVSNKDSEEINQQIQEIARSIYIGNLINKVEDNCLWDDRDNVQIGEKLKDADLIGCPIQLVVSKRSLESGGVEMINRKTGEKSIWQLEI